MRCLTWVNQDSMLVGTLDGAVQVWEMGDAQSRLLLQLQGSVIRMQFDHKHKVIGTVHSSASDDTVRLIYHLDTIVVDISIITYMIATATMSCCLLQMSMSTNIHVSIYCLPATVSMFLFSGCLLQCFTACHSVYVSIYWLPATMFHCLPQCLCFYLLAACYNVYVSIYWLPATMSMFLFTGCLLQCPCFYLLPACCNVHVSIYCLPVTMSMFLFTGYKLQCPCFYLLAACYNVHVSIFFLSSYWLWGRPKECS